MSFKDLPVLIGQQLVAYNIIYLLLAYYSKQYLSTFIEYSIYSKLFKLFE
jgi:hypothetical protein